MIINSCVFGTNTGIVPNDMLLDDKEILGPVELALKVNFSGGSSDPKILKKQSADIDPTDCVVNDNSTDVSAFGAINPVLLSDSIMPFFLDSEFYSFFFES